MNESSVVLFKGYTVNAYHPYHQFSVTNSFKNEWVSYTERYYDGTHKNHSTAFLISQFNDFDDHMIYPNLCESTSMLL